jgi:RNA polymerase sigma factor (TIGR02999 family)
VEHPLAVADAPDVLPSDAEGLFAALYAELRRLARRQVARGARRLTLGTTTHLHETYLDMARRDTSFEDRARFMAYAARVMRTVIVDHVRHQRRHKRGGLHEIVPLEAEVAAVVPRADEAERVARAVEELAAIDPELAQVVDLHFFCGLDLVEIARLRGQCERTVQRHWQKARLYLYDALRRRGDG